MQTLPWLLPLLRLIGRARPKAIPVSSEVA